MTYVLELSHCISDIGQFHSLIGPSPEYYQPQPTKISAHDIFDYRMKYPTLEISSGCKCMHASRATIITNAN